MKFTASRSDMAVAVANAASGLDGNPLSEIYGKILIDADWDTVTFTATNGDTTFSAGIKPDIESAGKTLLPGKLFAEIMRNFPEGELVFELDEGTKKAAISRGKGRSSFQLRASEPVNYPLSSSSASLTHSGTVPSGFPEAVRRAVPAVADNDSRPALTCIRLEPEDDKLFLVATDRYRLAVAECEWKPDSDPGECPFPLLPGRVIERFSRAIDGPVTIAWDNNHARFSGDGLQVDSRPVHGDFPDWRSLLPLVPPEIEVNTADLAGAVRRAFLATEKEDPIRLTFDGPVLAVQAFSDVGTCHEEVATSGAAESITAALGRQAGLLDGLAACGETCRVGYTIPGRPVYLYSDNFRYMMMPRRT